MNKLTLLLIATVSAAGLFVGGLVVGNVLREEPAEAEPEMLEVATAVPADLDVEADEVTEPPIPRPSARLLPAALLESLPDVVEPEWPPVTSDDDPSAPSGSGSGSAPGDPGSADGPDGDSSPPTVPDIEVTGGEPFRPPTVPGGVGEDGVGTPDPDVPYVVGDWVEELTLDDLYPVDEPASDPSGDGSEEEPALGDPPRTDDPADPMFRDPCADPAGESVEEDAEAAEERCPEGVGGTILLTDDGVPPNPLSIMAQFYIRISADVELRCPDLGTSVDGIYRPLFASNNPADFTIRYWPSVRPEEVREVTYRTSEAELDRWVERRLNGESIYADPRHGVHNCPELPLPDEMDHEQHFTIEIDGVDDMGTRASVRIYDVIESAEAQLGRPPMAFGSRRGDANSGFVSLPYDPDEETAYLAAIPKTGPRSSELTCTDIEPHVLAHRMSADPVLGPVRVAAMARRPGDPEFDPRFSIAAISELRPDEGTSYLLCAWATTPAARSFDLPNVVYRDSILVRAPRRLRVRISVKGGRTEADLAQWSVKVRPANWGSASGGVLPPAPVDAGESLRYDPPLVMFDSGSNEVPARTMLVVEGPGGATQVIEVRTGTECVRFGITVCPQPSVEEYDVALPSLPTGRRTCTGGLFGSCDGPDETIIGNLRIVVERYAGPGGVPTGGSADGWTVTSRGAFAGNRGERPARPQIDEHASYLREYRPSGDGRPGLQANLEFDRPVRVEMRPWHNYQEPCVEPDTHTVDEYRRVHSFRWDELCYGGTYSLSLYAVDEEGNELDLRTAVDGVRTGHPGWGYVTLSTVPIAEYTVELTIERIGDRIRPNSATLRIAGHEAGPFFAPGQPIRCVPPTAPVESYTRTIRNAGGRPIRWGDSVGLFLEVYATGDGIGCGLEERYVRIQISESLWLEDLLASPVHTFVYDEADAELTLTIRDIVPG